MITGLTGWGGRGVRLYYYDSCVKNNPLIKRKLGNISKLCSWKWIKILHFPAKSNLSSFNCHPTTLFPNEPNKTIKHWSFNHLSHGNWSTASQPLIQCAERSEENCTNRSLFTVLQPLQAFLLPSEWVSSLVLDSSCCSRPSATRRAIAQRPPWYMYNHHPQITILTIRTLMHHQLSIHH